MMGGDPWRYACPDCGSVSLTPIQGTSKFGPNPPISGKHFKCDRCGYRGRNKYDKKTDSLVKV